MTILIKKMPIRSLCRCVMPVLSAGGIMVGESFCFLPVGHDGPHRGPEGQLMTNRDELWREPRKK